jgi:hypothetical protein
VLFAGGLVAIVAFVAAGPERVAELMGPNCKRSSTGHDTVSVCSWRQALDVLKDLPIAVFLGALMLALLRPGNHERRSARGLTVAIGAGLLVVAVVLSAVGTQVYAKGYVGVRNVRIADRLVDEAKRFEVEAPRTKAPASTGDRRDPGGRSLVRPAAFRRALAELRGLAPAAARVSTLRVAPQRIDARVVSGTRVLALRKQGTGRAHVVSRSTVASADDRGLVAFSGVDVHAPRRIAAGATRAHGASARLDYAVLLDAGRLRWNAFLADGSQLRAAADGRHVQRLG